MIAALLFIASVICAAWAAVMEFQRLSDDVPVDDGRGGVYSKPSKLAVFAMTVLSGVLASSAGVLAWG
jgi:hypothetical protein